MFCCYTNLYSLDGRKKKSYNIGFSISQNVYVSLHAENTTAKKFMFYND
jgi:hypothetical protein